MAPSPDRRHRGDLQRHAGGRRPAGFNLQVASSWRSFERQLAIWNGKWRGAPLLDADNQPLDALQLGDMERLHAIPRWSALPGTSRHHWGTDLDIYDPDCLPAGTKLALEPWGMRRGLVCRLERVAGRSHERLRLLPALCRGRNRVRGGLRTLAPELRPESDELALDPAALALCLQGADIEGKACILAHLDEILARYVTLAHHERRI